MPTSQQLPPFSPYTRNDVLPAKHDVTDTRKHVTRDVTHVTPPPPSHRHVMQELHVKYPHVLSRHDVIARHRQRSRDMFDHGKRLDGSRSFHTPGHPAVVGGARRSGLRVDGYRGAGEDGGVEGHRGRN